jgi:hypothetical protein
MGLMGGVGSNGLGGSSGLVDSLGLEWI